MHGCTRPLLALLLCSLLCACHSPAPSLAPPHHSAITPGNADSITRAQMQAMILAALGDGDDQAGLSLAAALADGPRDGKLDDLIRRVHDAIETRSPREPATTERKILATLTSIRAAIDISLDNIRNARTVGYQRRLVHIRHDAAGLDISLSRAQGLPIVMDQPCHLMINGAGYFAVCTRNDKIAYTRAGNFFINADGNLVLGNSEGPPLEPIVTIPYDAMDLQISDDGVISAILPGDPDRSELGSIQLATFANPDGLAIDGPYLRETQSSGPPRLHDPNTANAGRILQRCLESSNVDPIAELQQILTLRRWSRTLRQAVELP